MFRPVLIAAVLAGVLSTAPSAFAEKEQKLFNTKASMAYFTPDGLFLIAAGNNNVRIIDLTAKKAHEIVKSYQPIVLAPDGKTLAAEDLSGGDTRNITLYDVPSGKPKGDPFSCPGDGVIADALTPDGKTFIHGGLKTVVLVDTSNGQIKQTFKNLGGQPFSVAVSPDGKYLACGTDSDGKRVWVWDLATYQPVRTLGGLPGFVQGVAFSADGKFLAATSNEIIRVWGLEDGKVVQSFKGPKDKVMRGVAFGADGKILVTDGSDGLVTIWDLTTGKPLDTIKTAKEPLNLSLSTDGKMLAVIQDGEQTTAYDLSAILPK